MEKFLKIDILDVASNADTKIAKVTGELSMTNSSIFKEKTEGVVEHGVINLVLDLSELKFIDSIGTLNLINLHIKTKRRGGNIRFVGVSDDIKAVFNTVGLTNLIPICKSIAEALLEVKSQREIK